MRGGRLWLCVAPAVLATLDKAMTLWGQPAEYWAGDYTGYNELNPVSAWSLGWHPLALVVQNFLWISAFGLLIVVLPRRMAKILALAIAMGHAAGVGWWLLIILQWFPLVMIHFLASAALLVFTWERADAESDITR
jgi:hypothetical protein